MSTRFYTKCSTPIGSLFIVSYENHIVAIYLGEADLYNEEDMAIVDYMPEDPLLNEAENQLNEYFRGERKEFDLPLSQQGTEFRMSVWDVLAKIPYGETRSYQNVAEAVGNPKAVRAIGQANKANKLPIIIPCHRVIGKNQSLTGYAGTRTDIKEKLLALEGAHFNN